MLILSLLLAMAGPGSSANVALGPAIDKVVSAQQAVGGAAGVVRDGKLVYVKTWGLRNIAKNEPVDANTRFEIGSVTKQFTAAAILQLQEHGKLSIDDRLAKYFPSFPHAHEITLRQMLNQVSGLSDYLNTYDPVKNPSAAGGLNVVAAAVNKPLHFAPGAQWEYCNTNYYVLGKVVEAVSHQSYEAYVREHLFAPAGMTHSAFVDDESKLDDFAIGYWTGSDGKGPVAAAPLITEPWAGGAGAIVSNLADLAAWDTALTHGKVVTAAGYALMSSPARLRDGSRDTYGMGLGIHPLEGHKRVWHNGGSMGSFTQNATYPDDHIDIIVFENSTAGDPNAVEVAMFEALFPDAALAARAPVAGELPAVRVRVMRVFDEVQRGTLQPRELTPGFAKFLTPDAQKDMSGRLMPLGAPTAFIFKGVKREANDTGYVYRVEFASGLVLQVFVEISGKTNLVDGIGIHPV